MLGSYVTLGELPVLRGVQMRKVLRLGDAAFYSVQHTPLISDEFR
jgi:hypothetical protein